MFAMVRQWLQRRRDLSEVLKMCNKIRTEKITRGRGTFFPKEEDRYLYDELVDKGKLVREPLENGYMFRDDYEALWGNVDKDNIVTPEVEVEKKS